jgi:mannose-1-phosphate guanylyltransferase/mannose-6-phosphate isomerase
MNPKSAAIHVTPVILCGGAGSRLWPFSRAGFPKQFLCLTGDDSLFQLDAKRMASLGAPDIVVSVPTIVTGEEHRFLAAEQLREVGIPLGVAVLELVGRGTAPALTPSSTSRVSARRRPRAGGRPRRPKHG